MVLPKPRADCGGVDAGARSGLLSHPCVGSVVPGSEIRGRVVEVVDESGFDAEILYVAFNIWMGLGALIFIVPALLYFGKALCDVMMLINGYYIYKEVIGDGSLL